MGNRFFAKLIAIIAALGVALSLSLVISASADAKPKKGTSKTSVHKPAKKPTKKPTHKPTKKPTHKPTPGQPKDCYANSIVTGTSVGLARYVGQYGDSNSATAYVTSSTNQTPVGSVTISISGPGVSQSWTMRLKSGTASHGLPSTLPPGATYAVTATYGGSGCYQGSSGSAYYSVQKGFTHTSVSSKDLKPGQAAKVSGVVTSEAGGKPNGSVTITIKKNGTTVDTATDTLNGAGRYSATMDKFSAKGTYTVTVSYSGSARYNTSSGSDTFTVSK